MSESHCEREIEVLGALRSGAWSDGLRAHAAECGICSDVVLVHGYIGELSAESATTYEPSAADRVWWKAQRRARQEAIERATRPIVLLHQVSWGLATVALAAIGWWNRTAVAEWLGRLAPQSRVAEASAGPQVDPLLLIGTALLALLVFGIYSAWAEE